jgi:Zn-dependent protease with chaperone function
MALEECARRGGCARRIGINLVLSIAVASLGLSTALAQNHAGDQGGSGTAWNPFSAQQEALLGNELRAWVDERVEPYADPPLERRVREVAERLATATAPRFAPAVHLFRAAEAYALALPGGDIYLSTRLLGFVQCDQELAGLLAHELAHTELRQLTHRAAQARRVSIHAALVASDVGKATLMEGLQAIGLEPFPGAPWFVYSPDEEAAAHAAAAARLGQAGFDPHAASGFHLRLQQSGDAAARTYLERHPLTADAAAQGGAPEAGRCVAQRAWRKLARKANRASLQAPALDALLAWTPPRNEPQAARSRERYIARSYLFDYPATWTPGKPGFDEKIQVAPKGGYWQPAGQPAQLVVGLSAGTLDVFDEDLIGDRTLRHHLDALRPGLEALPPAEAPAPSVPLVHEQFFTGESPAGGRERVWAFSRRLPERVFYLLLIAPATDFAKYRTEFEAIAASVDFQGHPRTGRADVQRQKGASK